MKTKKQRKRSEKKPVRRQEKDSDAKHDVMQGRAARRRYGQGLAK